MSGRTAGGLAEAVRTRSATLTNLVWVGLTWTLAAASFVGATAQVVRWKTQEGIAVSSATTEVVSVRYDARAREVGRLTWSGNVLSRHGVRRADAYDVGSPIVSATSSPAGVYVSVLSLSERGQEPAYRMDLVGADLEPIYRTALARNEDGPYPTVLVGDDGSAVVLWHAAGEIDFLSPRGVTVATNPLADGYEIERSLVASVAAGSGEVVVAVNEPPSAEARSRRMQAFVFSRTGERIRSIDIAPYQVSALGIGPMGSFLAVGQYDGLGETQVTTVIDSRGQIAVRCGFAAERIEFGLNANVVLLASKRQVELYDLGSGNRMAGHVAERGRTLQDVSLLESTAVGAVSARTRYAEQGFLHDAIEFVTIPIGDGTAPSRVIPIDGSSTNLDIISAAGHLSISLDDGLVVLEGSP